jgi:tetratricopeptide (TPR) repeat protein
VPEPAKTPRIPAWLWIVGIAALALALRIAYVVQVSDCSLIVPEELDPGFYFEWAKGLAAGDWVGKEPFVQSPLYAYLLGLWIALFGAALTPILVAQCVAGVGTVVLTWMAGRRFFDDRRAAIAALLVALYGPFIFYEGMVMKTFLSPLLTLALALLLERAARLSGGQQAAPADAAAAGPARRVPAVGAFVAAGIVFGLLTLDRDNFIVLAPVLAILAMVLGGGWRAGGLRAAAGFTAGAVLAIAPVTIRNYAVSGDFVLLTTGGGEVFFIGNNPDANGLYVPPPFVRPEPKYEHADFIQRASEITGSTLSPMQSSWFWFREGMRFVTGEPLSWLRLLWRKFVHFWNWYELPDNIDYGIMQYFSPLLAALNPALPPMRSPTLVLPAGGSVWLPVRLHLLSTFGILAPLGILGVVVTWRRRRALLPLLVLLFGYMATVLLFFNFSRFRVPIVPILALFAVDGIFAVGRALRRLLALVVAVAGRSGDMATRARSLLPGAGAAAVCLLFLAAATFVNVEHPRGVVPAIEQALTIGNAWYAQEEPEKARQAYFRGLVLLGEGPATPEGDALLAREFGPGVTREALLKELEVESVARGPQFKGLHLGVHHGLGIAMVQQAQTLLGQGKRGEALPLLDGAITQFEEALRIAPAYLLSHRKMARAHQLRGNTPAAVEWLRKAADLWPEDLDTRLELAEVLYSTGEFKEALGHLEAARHYNPGMDDDRLAQVHFYRGLIYLRVLSDDGRALFNMERALALNPDHPQAPAIRGAIRELKSRGVTPLEDEPGTRPGTTGAAASGTGRPAPASPATPAPPDRPGE